MHSLLELDVFGDGFIDDTPTRVERITEELPGLDDRPTGEFLIIEADEPGRTLLGWTPAPARR